MSSLSWYVHRLRAMNPSELASHFRRKLHQFSDSIHSKGRFEGLSQIGEGAVFPRLPLADSAPEELREALRKDTTDIQAGRWIAFGHLDLRVDDPPRWHKDYLSGADLVTNKPAFKLNHRLQAGADIKLIWEPSRWYQLVRLSQAAYVLGDPGPAETCIRWLKNWAQENPPYLGWNWTSALESGLRLVQFVWIDALLSNDGRQQSGLAKLRAEIIPPHLWYTWRDRSFGSSANNHLLGELAGLIMSLVRWPELACWAAPLDKLHDIWEAEVLRQFASDGGNLEQALSYHLFSWEFCWQTRLALLAGGRKVSGEVEERLAAAGAFYSGTRSETGQWDFGDSDGAWVTPFFRNWYCAPKEWQRWLVNPADSPAISYWIGEPPKPRNDATVPGAQGWRVYPESGQAIWRSADWLLRWDISELGFLATASHGHCDALHLSFWFGGAPLIIDPGTGAYYSDKVLRNYLAGWEAHNGPHPVRTEEPRRMGVFLWMNHHERPRWKKDSETTMSAELRLDSGTARRTIKRFEEEDSWQIDDAYLPNAADDTGQFIVFWQFAPGVRIEQTGPRLFFLWLGEVRFSCELDPGWKSVEHWSPTRDQAQPAENDLRGICSAGFRQTSAAPYIQLRGSGSAGAGLRTVIRVSPEKAKLSQ
jgi:hypothetical protein